MASKIPDGITAEHILAAARDFDAGKPHRFADSVKFDVIIEDNPYPPKAIIGLAAAYLLGEPLVPEDFSAGIGSKCFGLLTRLGFEIRRKLILASSDFELGRVYNRRRDLHQVFGGQQQGGISTPKNADFIMLFTGESGTAYGYSDGFDDNGVFLYTGEGQEGDMEFLRGNLAIRDHAADGKSLELFESLGKGKGCRYLGSFICGSWENRRGPDRGGAERETIVFHLVPAENEFDDRVDDEPETPTESLDELRMRAYEAGSSKIANSKEAKRITHQRSRAVKDYVLARATGICESCREPAPFTTVAGQPYLEPHHTRRISDGGPDHPCWVGAVCPNCHREIHFGENGPDKNAELQHYLAQIEEA